MPTCSASLAIVLLVTSCVGALGLAPVSGDEDRDGVLDDADNCPGVVNPRQQDLDLDGIGDHCGVCESPLARDDDGDGIDDACDSCVGPGEIGEDSGGNGIDDGCEPCVAARGEDIDVDGVDDVCDSCLRGPPFDEDGDSVHDACDVCPSRPDPLQATDNDDDRLGDACDPDTDPLGASGMKQGQTARLFDGFNVTRPLSWADEPNTLSGGALHLGASTTLTSRVELRAELLIETRFSFSSTAPGASFQLRITGTPSSTCQPGDCTESAATCTVTSDGQLSVESFSSSTISQQGVDVGGPVMVWFRNSRSNLSPGGGHSMICVAVGPSNIVTAALHDEPLPIGNVAYDLTLRTGAAPLALDYTWIVLR